MNSAACSAPSTSTLNRHQPAWSSRDDATNAPAVSESGCSARVSAEAGSLERGRAVSDVIRAGGVDMGTGVAGRVLGVICTRKTFSSPGRAVIRRRFTQGVSPRKASPAGAARSSAGRRSHSGIVSRLLRNHQPAPAAINARAIAAKATGSHDLPRAGLAGTSSCLRSVVSESVIVSVPVSGMDFTRGRFGRCQAGGAAIRSVDRAAIPGVACGTG